MGKVIFKQTETVQEMHGTFCGMVYRRTPNGETVVHLQRASMDMRREVVRQAVALAQEMIYEEGEPSVRRMQEIADMHHVMKQVLNEWYEGYAAKIRRHDKLVEALAVNYCNKFAAPKLDLDTS